MRPFPPMSLSLACLAVLLLGVPGCSSPAAHDGLTDGADAGRASADGGVGTHATSRTQDAGSLFGSGSAQPDADHSCDNSLDLAGCACPAESAPRSCYAGAPSQAGVGSCTMGTQACVDQDEGLSGTWGPCTGSGMPTTCAASSQCGTISDGCGGMLDCGTCPAGQDCGAGGVANQCACAPTTCAALGDNCGSASDGCGGMLDCGTCPAGQDCGAGGVANQCACAPTTCAALGASCGSASDGCGGTLDCGSCPSGSQCGAGGVPNQCGCAGCCPSQTVAFVNCGATGTMKPGAFNVQSIDCTAVKTSTALKGFDTIVYVGPLSPAANADFPPAISTQLAAGAKVLFIPTGTCDGTSSGTCAFGANNWQTVYSDLYLEDNMEFGEKVSYASITIPNPDSMTAAFSSSTYGSYAFSHLMFNGSVATDYLSYPGGALSGTFAWCSDLVAENAAQSTPFHGYLLDSGSRKGLLIVTTLDYAHAGNTFDFGEPFLAAHLSQPWNQKGDSAACGLSCSTSKPWIPATGLEKPVIYLYPTKDEDVTVRLDLNGRLVRTYPEYDTAIRGWKVHARPDGELRALRDGHEYSYLYWTGESAAFEPSFDEGFVVDGKSTRQFLQSTLAKMGLLPREYNEMIVYWLPYMESHPYNLISFADTSYTDVAKLTVTPKPDSMLRVFMVFKKLESPFSVRPQKIQRFERKGFAVVEWGGTEIGGEPQAVQ